jgi:GC-rich sequence DNA-binding factor
MYAKAQMETPTTPHSLFFYRQFWSALKLFRNILAWQVQIYFPIVSVFEIIELLGNYQSGSFKFILGISGPDL